MTTMDVENTCSWGNSVPMTLVESLSDSNSTTLLIDDSDNWLQFKRGDIFAVEWQENLEKWKGINIETGKTGYFDPKLTKPFKNSPNTRLSDAQVETLMKLSVSMPSPPPSPSASFHPQHHYQHHKMIDERMPKSLLDTSMLPSPNHSDPCSPVMASPPRSHSTSPTPPFSHAHKNNISSSVPSLRSHHHHHHHRSSNPNPGLVQSVSLEGILKSGTSDSLSSVEQSLYSSFNSSSSISMASSQSSATSLEDCSNILYRTNSLVFLDDEEAAAAATTANTNANASIGRIATYGPPKPAQRASSFGVLPSTARLTRMMNNNENVSPQVAERRQKCLERAEFAKNKREQIISRRHSTPNLTENQLLSAVTDEIAEEGDTTVVKKAMAALNLTPVEIYIVEATTKRSPPPTNQLRMPSPLEKLDEEEDDKDDKDDKDISPEEEQEKTAKRQGRVNSMYVTTLDGISESEEELRESARRRSISEGTVPKVRFSLPSNQSHAKKPLEKSASLPTSFPASALIEKTSKTTAAAATSSTLPEPEEVKEKQRTRGLSSIFKGLRRLGSKNKLGQ